MNWYTIIFEMLILTLALLVGMYYGIKIGVGLGKRYMLLEFTKNKKLITDLLFDDYIKTDKDSLVEKLKKSGIL